MRDLGHACRSKVFFLIIDVFRQPKTSSEGQGHEGLRCNMRYSLLKPVTNSVREFKYHLFYVKPMEQAAKKEVVKPDEKGEVVKSLFPLSLCKEYYDLESSYYAYQVSKLSGKEARTLELLTSWVNKFTMSVKKIDCRVVLECHNRHTLCSTCKTRVHNRCPTCRQELGDIRCLALEKVAESLDFPCKFYSLGCPEIFPYYSKLKHETLCNFRPYVCPYAGSECSVAGDIPFLVSLLRDDLKVGMDTGFTINHCYVNSNPREVENATWMLTISVFVKSFS